VFQPDRIALMQLGSFLALAITWQIPAPSLGASIEMTPPLIAAEVINQYRQSENEYSAGHRGVDYAVELGQGVFAPMDGAVHFVGNVVDRPLISLTHEVELLTAFEPVCSDLSVGQEVSQGDLIGEVCEADAGYQQHCERAFCLHFSVRRDGEYLSPLWFTGQLDPSKLLPWIEPPDY